ncbi:Alanine--tRNA ligase, partial [Dissostichus eleginoides]
CHCEFMCHHGLGCNHKLRNLESGVRGGGSLHVGPDLPVGDTDSSSPPASLSRLRGEKLTPYFPAVTADSGLSNVPAAASSSIIKRLRRIEIISIRAPSVSHGGSGARSTHQPGGPPPWSLPSAIKRPAADSHTNPGLTASHKTSLSHLSTCPAHSSIFHPPTTTQGDSKEDCLFHRPHKGTVMEMMVKSTVYQQFRGGEVAEGSHPSLKPTCVTLFDGGSSKCSADSPCPPALPLCCAEIRPYRTSGRRKKMELTSRVPRCYAGLDMLLTKF